MDALKLLHFLVLIKFFTTQALAQHTCLSYPGTFAISNFNTKNASMNAVRKEIVSTLQLSYGNYLITFTKLIRQLTINI